MVRLLKSSEVEDLLDLRGVKDCLADAFAQQAQGQVQAWPPGMMRSGGAIFLLRAGGLSGEARMGVRSTTGPHNPSFVTVYETPTGRPLGIVSYPFSDLRLHASAALGIDHLAKPDAQRVAMIGSGRNALGLLQGASLVRGIADVRVYSPNPEHRAHLVAEVEAKLGLAATATASAREAVEDAEIIIVATSSNEPTVQGAWLRPDAHVTSIGSRMELDEDVYRRAELIVANSKVHEWNVLEIEDAWPIVRLARAGVLDWERVPELGQVIAGKIPRPTGISVYRDARGGFDDVALAVRAYERAVALGRGTDWDPE